MTVAEIITIGTELLLGETVDTNTRFIARRLRGLGVDLYRTLTVGDNTERIAEAVRQAMGRADVVITTGGLGPTVDDPTRQAIAQAAGTQLEFHPELWEQIVQRIQRYGREPGENQKRQAYIPRHARVIENPVGTAPAFIVESRRGMVICLPGVPNEMETLLDQAVLPYLKQRFDLRALIKVRTLHVSGIGEGSLDELVGDLETLANPTVGLTAHSGVVDVRIAAKATEEAEADRMITAVETDLRTRLGANVFGSDDENLEGVTLNAASARGWSVSCLESGLDGALLTRLARSGHPAYRNGSSRTVAPDGLAEAADAQRRASGASVCIAVALTSGMDRQEIALVLAGPFGQQERRLTYGGHPRNAPRWATNAALDALRRLALEIR